jgi:hypothetical protein
MDVQVVALCGHPRTTGGVIPCVAWPNLTSYRLSFALERGAPGRIRTCDARFRKPTLYPLSYEGGAWQKPSLKLSQFPKSSVHAAVHSLDDLVGGTIVGTADL